MIAYNLEIATRWEAWEKSKLGIVGQSEKSYEEN